jgi:hypothetical protein
MEGINRIMPVNASSFPAPSAAAIAAAVAAPSAATIATAVAAAVPTISAINSSVASNAPSPNGWVLLGTGNLQNTASATISFSAYKKLRIVWKFVMQDAQAPVIRLNGDTGSNYVNTAILEYDATSNPMYQNTAETFLRISIGNSIAGSMNTGFMEVENAGLSSSKLVRCQNITQHSSLSNARGRWDGNSVYRTSSAITSVTITGNSGSIYADDVYNATAFQVFGAN